MKAIKSYFQYTAEHMASDLHLVEGEKPMIRVQGQLQDIEDKPLTGKEVETQVLSLLSPEQKKRFEDQLELDVSYETDEARFRVNLHRQEGKIGLAARLIPRDIPTPDQLRLEPPVRGFTNLLDGLILVVGPTGNGKSTTIASMIEEINKTRKSHIVTIEDPIEFLFEDKESLIAQREVGEDTHSFEAALKHVLRQDPNVILVGKCVIPRPLRQSLPPQKLDIWYFQRFTHQPRQKQLSVSLMYLMGQSKNKF